MEFNNIVEKIENNPYLHKEVDHMSRYLDNSGESMMIFIKGDDSGVLKTELVKSLRKNIRDFKRCDVCIDEIFSSIKTSKKEKGSVAFSYKKGSRYGLCCPLVYDSNIFGFIVLCGMRKAISPGLLQMFSAFLDSLIRELRVEIELEDVNKTIRPRAIAVSTVHTVHRLITSTLDLGELLPRIARLALQVIKANRCSIKLVDKKHKILIPQTTIDLRHEKTKLKKVQIGRYAPGKAVKRGTSIRGSNYLATPMIDEDVVGAITLYDKIDGGEFTLFDEEIMKTLAEQAAIAIRNAQLFKEQSDLTLSTIKCIAQLMENRPSGIRSYVEASYMRLIYLVARKFNMNTSEIKMLQYAAMLHDTGQISVPEKVLMKKGGLTGREYDIVKTHPTKGAAILSKFKPLKPIVPIIMHHHENFDGTGYPKGLKGKDIPLAARILAVCASFEAMISHKPYRRALSLATAVGEIRKGRGKQFDPEIVDVFCEAVQRKDVSKLLQKELGRKS